MENQVVCPHCKKVYSNNPIIEAAAKREGSDTQSINCSCGERITYWQIADQLRNQQTVGYRFQKWLRSLSHSQG